MSKIIGYLLRSKASLFLIFRYMADSAVFNLNVICIDLENLFVKITVFIINSTTEKNFEPVHV